MKVCTAQVAVSWEDPAANLHRATQCVGSAKAQGAELVCFPEQFATGWSPRSTHFAEDKGGPTVITLCKIARDNAIFLVGSYVERHDPRPLNTSVAIDPKGDIVASFSKIHPFSPGGEDLHYDSGDHLSLFSVGGVRFGIAICYDLRFAPLFRAYALAGVHCVLVPSAWPCSRTRAWETLVQARALDNQFYVLGCNPTGDTPVDRYCGHSLSADPFGAIVSRGGEEEELVMTEVDPSKVDAARVRMPVEKDRRLDLYHYLMENRDS